MSGRATLRLATAATTIISARHMTRRMALRRFASRGGVEVRDIGVSSLEKYSTHVDFNECRLSP
jgi:hypothetical protein